jgi:DNA repair protein RadA/Sms
VSMKTVLLGEIGLAGEIRGISHVETRIREAARLGFKRALIPASNFKNFNSGAAMTVNEVRSVREAVDRLF